MPAAAPVPLLDPTAIARAEALGLFAREIVEGYMIGENRSPFHGFSIEFTQHREYAPGDDLRHLDWKVLGRTDRLYLKQYEQETNYVAHLLLDGSESMAFGSGPLTKLDYGKLMAACLAYVILLQRDAVSLQIFDTAARVVVPRSAQRDKIFEITARLAAFQPGNATRIGPRLHELAGQIKRRGIVILLSDFFDDEAEVLHGIQHLRFDGHEVIVFQILDPQELELPFAGLVEFEGLENLPKLVTRPAEIRASYLRELQQFLQNLRQGCERNQCHYTLVNTAQPLHETLAAYLAFRRRTATR
jgi:uncharacterized protein (DUF58 family)